MSLYSHFKWYWENRSFAQNGHLLTSWPEVSMCLRDNFQIYVQGPRGRLPIQNCSTTARRVEEEFCVVENNSLTIKQKTLECWMQGPYFLLKSSHSWAKQYLYTWWSVSGALLGFRELAKKLEVEGNKLRQTVSELVETDYVCNRTSLIRSKEGRACINGLLFLLTKNSLVNITLLVG